jgi:hypothetical protein
VTNTSVRRGSRASMVCISLHWLLTVEIPGDDQCRKFFKTCESLGQQPFWRIFATHMRGKPTLAIF